MSSKQEIDSLKAAFPWWKITEDGKEIRAERNPWPVQIAGNASLLAVILSGLDVWELRDLVRINCAS